MKRMLVVVAPRADLAQTRDEFGRGALRDGFLNYFAAPESVPRYMVTSKPVEVTWNDGLRHCAFAVCCMGNSSLEAVR